MTILAVSFAPLSIAEAVLLVLAAARLTQMIGRDGFTGPLRAPIYRWAYRREHGADEVATWSDLRHWSSWDAMVDADGPEAPPVAYLIRCVWCLGFHVSWAWTLAAVLWRDGWYWASLVLACSWLLVLAHNVIAAVAAAADR